MNKAGLNRSGKLYCTFLFSDESEWELFVGKILSEKNLVEHWFVVEGQFSFKGEFIGSCAKKMLHNEPRLLGLTSRITIITNHENFFEGARNLIQPSITDRLRSLRNIPLSKVLQKERIFFSVEKRTRDLSTATILDICQE